MHVYMYVTGECYHCNCNPTHTLYVSKQTDNKMNARTTNNMSPTIHTLGYWKYGYPSYGNISTPKQAFVSKRPLALYPGVGGAWERGQETTRQQREMDTSPEL